MTISITPLTATKLPNDCFVFKHSTQCPISAEAADEIRNAPSADLPLYWVNVIEQRSLSNWIESMSGVRHESPQLLEFRGGKAVRNWSHRAISASCLHGRVSTR